MCTQLRPAALAAYIMAVTDVRVLRSAHEVFIDDAQLQWLEEQLTQAGQRPVAVFTHAPIMGSGLRAVLPVRFMLVSHA